MVSAALQLTPFLNLKALKGYVQSISHSWDENRKNSLFGTTCGIALECCFSKENDHILSSVVCFFDFRTIHKPYTNHTQTIHILWLVWTGTRRYRLVYRQHNSVTLTIRVNFFGGFSRFWTFSEVFPSEVEICSENFRRFRLRAEGATRIFGWRRSCWKGSDSEGRLEN